MRTVKLPNHRAILAEQGFEMRKEDKALGGMVVSELWRAKR